MQTPARIINVSSKPKSTADAGLSPWRISRSFRTFPLGLPIPPTRRNQSRPHSMARNFPVNGMVGGIGFEIWIIVFVSVNDLEDMFLCAPARTAEMIPFNVERLP